jgi:type III restriction enzyme
MELKRFQKTVLDDLRHFLALLRETGDISRAYRTLWEEHGVSVDFGGMEAYKRSIPGVPDVCLKVPTGGGKTFIAACAIKTIFDSLGDVNFTRSKAIVWLVPSDSILEQTLKNLLDASHPYRQRINANFGGRVEVYSKEQLLTGQNFNPTVVSEQLSLFVLSYDSFRTSKKEGRKAYQENGNLVQFQELYKAPETLLDGADDTALIQAIRYLNPLVIVDESHHASTPLSVDMLENFNPCFILDLTATPKKASNVISFVSAYQLKRENMVKLPVIVYNHASQADVFRDAVALRDRLEAEAKRERKTSGRYIRPVALFQAQPKNNKDSETFEKVKRALLDMDIPEDRIAVKTSEHNDLRGVDLLSERCPIRYIITVNALKEGWDCPFAYVLATVANRSSAVDVEQILGRILRLPYTASNESKMLNLSYVLTNSGVFQDTLQRIIEGLNNAGFSERDYRAKDLSDAGNGASSHPEDTVFLPFPDAETFQNEENEETSADGFEEPPSGGLPREGLPRNGSSLDEAFVVEAIRQEEDYAGRAAKSEETPSSAIAPEVREKMNLFPMNEQFAVEAKALLLPQFVISSLLFQEDEPELLAFEDLTDGFSLKDEDTKIDFTSLEAEIVRVDVEDENDTPKAWKLTEEESEYIKRRMRTLPPEGRIKMCKELILGKLNKIDAIDYGEIASYVERVMNGLDREQLEDLQQSPHLYCEKIKRKVENLLSAHAERVFTKWIEQGRIRCVRAYAFENEISPVRYTTKYGKSLYNVNPPKYYKYV